MVTFLEELSDFLKSTGKATIIEVGRGRKEEVLKKLSEIADEKGIPLIIVKVKHTGKEDKAWSNLRGDIQTSFDNLPLKSGQILLIGDIDKPRIDDEEKKYTTYTEKDQEKIARAIDSNYFPLNKLAIGNYVIYIFRSENDEIASSIQRVKIMYTGHFD